MTAILDDGPVATWGDAACGGDCSAVQDLLAQCTSLPGNLQTWNLAMC